ncbi:MAG: CPBP family intramembrane metalloprotease [Lewinellaceae bacterium]|nr:CPBP family intramembrane metalloprotease [Lewinellaceae bacterium]
MGVWPAIAINTSLYAITHVPKGETEGIGAIPLGVLFCLITLESGTIWVAVLVHWVMSLSNEWLSLKHHPEIGLVKK